MPCEILDRAVPASDVRIAVDVLAGWETWLTGPSVPESRSCASCAVFS